MLCDEVGARGDFDRLSTSSLAASTATVEDMGLLEMLVSQTGHGCRVCLRQTPVAGCGCCCLQAGRHTDAATDAAELMSADKILELFLCLYGFNAQPMLVIVCNLLCWKNTLHVRWGVLMCVDALSCCRSTRS